ncbi:MAG: rhomboid family intramembrane serine protease [Planctomycetota bacterium]
MRLAGTIPNPAQARRFHDYLTTIDIDSSIRDQSAEDGSTVHGIWILAEAELERARQELEAFVVDPSSDRYASAEKVVAEIRAKRAVEDAERAAREVDFRRRWRTPTWRDVPVTLTLILVSVTVQWILMTSGLEENEYARHPLTKDILLSPSMVGNPSAEVPWIPPEVARGEVWRLITPIFLHFGVFHLLFNALMTFRLGVMIEARRGSLRFLGLALLTAIASNYAQYFSTPFSAVGGLSGVLFGLLGYAWMRSKYEPRFGIVVSPPFVALMMFWLVFCMVAVNQVANTAHAAGLVMGLLIGLVPTISRRRRRQPQP